MWRCGTSLAGRGLPGSLLPMRRGTNNTKWQKRATCFTSTCPHRDLWPGDGKEWVRIEALELVEDADAESEYFTITARPVANPRHHAGVAIAHFFSHNSTNTFIVERYQNNVSVAVHGRNETPNTDTNIYDTVRNTIIALTARAGLSFPQWKSLASGILEYK